MHACACVCMRVCVSACVRACVRVCVCVCEFGHNILCWSYCIHISFQA